MTLRQPSILLRALVLGAQGVFYNLFCKPFMFLSFIVLTYALHQVLSYMISPSISHRFVGYLEEEAVLT